MAQIFISYKRVNKDKVFSLVSKIENTLECKCWVDIEGIESSAQFASVICRAIDQADVVLFMHSSVHLSIDFENDWTIREINYAQKRNKRIIFLNLDDAPLSAWFELMFGLKQQVDVSSDVAMNKLYGDLLKWLDVTDLPLAKKTNKNTYKILIFVVFFSVAILCLVGVFAVKHIREKQLLSLELSLSYDNLLLKFDEILQESNSDNICNFEKAYQCLSEIRNIENSEFFKEFVLQHFNKNKQKCIL